MIFKLAEAAQRSWRRLDGQNQLPKLITGVKFTDGIEAQGQEAQTAAAWTKTSPTFGTSSGSIPGRSNTESLARGKQRSDCIFSVEGFHSSEFMQHLAFYRYREFYPKKNGSPRNCCSHACDEQSAVPVCV
jgi:hypothetical protein